MHACAAIVAAGFLACAGIAIPARAATNPAPVEVARSAKVTLFAGDEQRKLCIGFGPEALASTCADEPDEGVATVSDAGTDGPLYLGAAVASAAVRVEVRRAGTLLASGPTVAGAAYTGVRAGSVRFALLALPADAPADGLRIRALNAAGMPVAVLTTDGDAELVLARNRLASGRSSGVGWSLVSEQRSELTPSVLDFDHETVSRCLVATFDSVESGSVCVSGAPLQTLNPFDPREALSAEACNPAFRLLYGVVDATVTSVIVVRGDGSRRTVRTLPVDEGHRAYALVTGSGAVRSVTLPGHGVLRPALAPLPVVCAGNGQGLTFVNFGSSAFGLVSLLLDLPPVTPVGPVTTIPGTPGMQVADGPADTLCIALAGRPFDGLGCGIVAPPPGDTVAALDDVLHPGAFAVAVPALVASVRLSTKDRTTVRSVPTVPGAGYAGRYAGFVRFASAAVPGIEKLTRLELLDGTGRVLHTEGDGEDDIELPVPRVGAARRVAGRAGRPSLWQTTVRYGKGVDRCLSLTAGPAPGPKANCQTGRDPTTILLDVPCATHRLSAGIAVRAGTRVVAETGPVRRRRAVRLRNGVAVLTLPAGRSLRSLTFTRKGRARDVTIAAPPGARQCGWHLVPDVEQP